MMNGFWGFREIRPALLAVVLVLVLVYQHLSFCWSLSDKGIVLSRSKETVVHDSFEDGNGGKNLCRSDVECSRGNAVALSVEKPRNVAHRKLMAVTLTPFNLFGPFVPPFWVSPGPVQSAPPPSPSPFSPSPAPLPSMVPQLAPAPPRAASITPSSVPAPAEGPSPSVSSDNFSGKHHRVLIVSAAIGGSVLVVALFIVIVFSQKNKMAVVRPWATGLSGQLQRAFVTGVPKLKRQELETACEDFSNVIGSSSVCTLYKGTLSSGVEIAVMSLTFASAKDWSRDHEAQFRKKIDSLSKVNHKNFVNLIGYCEEKEPFTRMMVFEYAPNGTLFEHLHIREAEHLDWGARMRVIMGTAYCLGHMHQMAPPIAHKNLKSSAIQLAEDSAAKISDFAVWNESADDETDATPESNVYSFGVILLEVVTGRLPYSPNGTALEDFASDYLRGTQSLREMADPTLTSFQEHQLDGIGEVIKSCLRLSPRLRPTMREVADRLREITGIGPDGAIPKLSPLWWAELEIQSADISN
ncbi:probable inactive receptor-like protein kinase At3g56050 [Ipomoea triloba]|uniref:probable inactive receptor-like protein kinase At3g56050 n=1 Tax=Ipomoea triloba TaxID=35885 RepID=UPI00125D4431|nr:probable inactive receptor-like protein kinase At3g56050 [Ipomoea triloba]